MVRLAVFGAGRIGVLHAGNIAASNRAELAGVMDVNAQAARQLAAAHTAPVFGSVEEALAQCDAVLIATSTDTHVELLLRAAKAGKAVLCEKPIDLNISRVNECRDALQALDVPVQLGFNRRYDPDHRSAVLAAQGGAVGAIELAVITSRDPAPPPLAYIKVSGGLFRDMMIHDFDMARFVLGEDPVEVSATASVLVDPAIGQAGDVDTAAVTLRTASGKLCLINCSRRAVYGYDQRVEILGSAGMVCSGNRTATTVERFTATQTAARDPLLNFFLERYMASYRAELDDFIDAVEQRRPPSVTFEDGRKAQVLAEAAIQALKEQRTVRVDWA